MTIWTPTLTDSSKSKYVAICESISQDIADGILKPGQKLPTQRWLAKTLDVTVGTIGRAYALAEKQGLITLEIGRGSFIRSFESRTNEINDQSGIIDLGLNLPPSTQLSGLFAKTLAQLANDRSVAEWFGNAPVESFEHHRAAAASWLSDRCKSSADNTLICSGTQNALVSALSTLTSPGDGVMVERLTFPGMISAAKILNLNLIPLDFDEAGLIPDQLSRKSKSSKVLYCVPTNHNPSTITMPLARRKKIANLAAKHKIVVLEDDVYGKLIPDAPPTIASLIPDRTILISSIAKTISIGLRLAFVRVPDSFRTGMLESMRATNFFPSPILSEVATRLIEGGDANRLLDEFKAVAKRRQDIAAELLPSHLLPGMPAGNHVWLKLPDAWSPTTLARAASENNVNIYPADLFVPEGAEVPNAIRVSLGAARNESELIIGLKLIARLLGNQFVEPETRY